MFEDYYGYPYDSFNIFDYLLRDGAFSRFDPSLVPGINDVVPVEPQPQYAPVTAEPAYTPPTLLPVMPEPAPAEPVYTLPSRQPVVAEPAPAEPVYTLPSRQPIMPEPAPAEPVYTPPTLLPVMPEPAPVEPVYTLPAPQPVVAEPAPAEPVYTPPTPQPVVAEPVPAEPAYYAPAPQPVMAEAIPALSPLLPVISESPVAEQTAAVTPPSEPDWASMTGWDPSMIVTTPLSVLADPGPAYDPNMVYRFDTGNKIGVPNAAGGFDYQNAAPVVFQPGQQYVLTDRSGKNVIARANTPEEMQRLVDLSSSEGNWSLFRADESGNIVPGTQLFSKNENLNLGSVLLPMAAVAGAGLGLSALGLGAGAAGAGAAGAMPSVGAALADVGAQLAGTSVFGLPAAATTAGTLAAAAPAFGGITVVGAPAAGVSALAPAALGAGTLGAALAAAQPGPINYGDQVYDNTAPEPDYSNVNEIVVESPSIAPPAPTPPLSLADIATLAPLAPPITSIPNVDVPMQELPAEPPAPEPEIVVEAPKQPPLTIDEIMTLPAATTLAPNTSTITEPSTVQPEAQQDTLLRDIMRYYSLGSGLLDALGIGQGSSAAPTTPYTPTLGVLPTFGRGAFTPYQGDYEQYGFGPEFNFFGGAQTNG